MIAMMIQPMVSSMIAEATMIWPTLRRMKFISRTTMATILTEEIDSAVPRNSEVTRRACGCGSSESGQELRRARSRRRTARDAGERDADRRAADLAHQREIGLHAGQQQQQQDAELRDAVDHAPSARASSERARAARRARARRTPTGRAGCRRAVAPITAGWPIRCMTSPRPRPTAISSTIWPISRNSGACTGRFAALGTGRNGGEDKSRGDKADRSEQAPLHAGILTLHLPRRGAGMTGIEPAAGNRSSSSSRPGKGATPKNAKTTPCTVGMRLKRLEKNFVSAENQISLFPKSLCAVGQNTGMMASSAD